MHNTLLTIAWLLIFANLVQMVRLARSHCQSKKYRDWYR